MRRFAKIACFIAALASLGAAGCSSPAPPAAPTAGVDALVVTDLEAGTGAAVTRGQRAVVEYTGWLYDAAAADHKGRKFDSSLDAGQPFGFVVGAGNVIKGWDQGVEGMRVGGSRRLVIPPSLAYGDAGAGGVIPPGATLVFDVHLVSAQ